MVTNKLTAEQKRKRMLEDKAKRKVVKERDPQPYEAPKKINPRYIEEFYDYDNTTGPTLDN